MKPYNFDALILDDDTERRMTLVSSLQFVGLNCHNFDFVSWLQQGKNVDLSAIGLVLVGHSSLPIALDKLLAELQWQSRPLPKVLLCDWDELDGESADALNILARETPPYHYWNWLDRLHQCSLWFQQQPAETGRLCFDGFVGRSPAVGAIRQLIAQVADRDVNVLITGESGTGKEVVAQALHRNSSRRERPFVPINCGAIPSELLESELFGHEKGAFTGAISSRAGRFEMADGGTLFLDEIGDMPLSMQVKLLRVLQERQFERVGGSKTLEVDVRIITATHKDLEAMVARGEFREDLYYRLNVFPIEMPPLRERCEDLGLLINAFVSRFDAQGLGRISFHPAALESLSCHPWPGNVRELANLIERLTITHAGQVIGVSDLPAKFRHLDEPNPERYVTQVPDTEISSADGAWPSASMQLPPEGIDLKQFLEHHERALIEQALDGANQVVARAAKQLQIRRTTLVEKMRKYGISRDGQ